MDWIWWSEVTTNYGKQVPGYFSNTFVGESLKALCVALVFPIVLAVLDKIFGRREEK